MQQACAGPYRIIVIVFVELIETQGLDWPAEPACGFCRHLRRPVGRSNVEARRDHLGRMPPRPAAELQDLGVTRQSDEEGVQPRKRTLRPFDIFSRVLPIETDRGVVEAHPISCPQRSGSGQGIKSQASSLDQPCAHSRNVGFGSKIRRTQHEQMSSGVLLKTDIPQRGRHVANGPEGDMDDTSAHSLAVSLIGTDNNSAMSG
jgi:hypothetical protein